MGAEAISNSQSIGNSRFLSYSFLIDMLSLKIGEHLFCKEICWGYSSAGRAPALQAGGHRFEPDYLHQHGLIAQLVRAHA